MNTKERQVATEATQQLMVGAFCDNERVHDYGFLIDRNLLMLNIDKLITVVEGQPEVTDLEQKITTHKEAMGCKSSTISCLVRIGGDYWNVRGISK